MIHGRGARATPQTEPVTSVGPPIEKLIYYQAGVETLLADDVNLPTDGTTLRVVTKSDGTIDLYAGASMVYATNNSLNNALTAAGIFNYGAGLGLQNRWDNFVIFDAP